MKLTNRTSIKGVFFLLVFSFFSISCEKEAKILLLEMEIAELVCKDGQKIFEGRILELEGIKAVSANIQTQKAQVRHRENMVTANQIRTHLADFGFTIDGVAGDKNARSRLPQCCFNNSSQ